MDLRCLLFQGGAGTNMRDVRHRIDSDQLGAPLIERLELVQKCMSTLRTNLQGRKQTQPRVIPV